MGFGILLVGYYLTFLLGDLWKGDLHKDFDNIDILWPLLLLLGSAIVLTALTRLTEYEKSFRVPMIFGCVMTLPALYRVLSWMSVAFLWGETALFSDAVKAGVEYMEFILTLGFGISLLLAVRKLASDVEDSKIVVASVRNLVFLGLFTILWIVSQIPFPYARLVEDASFVTKIIYHILVSVMFISCYMRICDESDKDMPIKQSRFAWVNKIREERARREQRAADSVTEYAENKLRKQRAEREKILRERKENRKNGKGRRR